MFLNSEQKEVFRFKFVNVENGKVYCAMSQDPTLHIEALNSGEHKHNVLQKEWKQNQVYVMMRSKKNAKVIINDSMLANTGNIKHRSGFAKLPKRKSTIPIIAYSAKTGKTLAYYRTILLASKIVHKTVDTLWDNIIGEIEFTTRQYGIELL